MRAERVVEIHFDGCSRGSGYLVSGSHALTAWHVLPEGAGPGTACRVHPLAPLDTRGLPLAQTRRPAPLTAKVAWPDTRIDGLDIAVIELDTPLDLGPGNMALGHLSTRDLESRTFACRGFPAAAKKGSHGMEGKASIDPDTHTISLAVEGARPRDYKRWAGMSGAMVFHGQAAVAVVRGVDANWDGKLTATPLRLLVEHEDFVRFWRATGQSRLRTVELSTAARSALERIPDHLYRLDRVDPVADVEALCQAMGNGEPMAPQVVVVHGMAADLHRHFIRQVAESEIVRRVLGRDAPAEELIPLIDWPEAKRLPQPEAELAALVARLCKLAGAAPTAAALRERLDEEGSVRACWTLMHRSMAFGGHRELMRGLLRFWASLGTGRPAVLFVCIAVDPPQADALLSLFSSRKPELESDDDLRAMFEDTGAVITYASLEKIAPAHIQPWLTRVKSDMALAAEESRLDLLGTRLEARVGPGQHLARVADELGQLIPALTTAGGA